MPVYDKGKPTRSKNHFYTDNKYKMSSITFSSLPQTELNNLYPIKNASMKVKNTAV